MVINLADFMGWIFWILLFSHSITRVLEDTQMIDSFWSRLESLSSPRPWKRIFAPGGDFAWYYIWASFAYSQMPPAFFDSRLKMRCNRDWGQMLNWSENLKSNSEIKWAPENNPWRSFYFLCAVFLYSNGNNPVLFRNNSANRLEVE